LRTIISHKNMEELITILQVFGDKLPVFKTALIDRWCLNDNMFNSIDKLRTFMEIRAEIKAKDENYQTNIDRI